MNKFILLQTNDEKLIGIKLESIISFVVAADEIELKVGPSLFMPGIKVSELPKLLQSDFVKFSTEDGADITIKLSDVKNFFNEGDEYYVYCAVGPDTWKIKLTKEMYETLYKRVME